ncbi:MAG: AAA family ATPase [Bacillota bacterium]
MKSAPIVIISGPPGSGKSSVARRLAENSAYERAIHMHTDDFYQYVRKGYISTWLPEAREQNVVILEAFTASATRYALGGYEVIVDGIIGPWFLDPWIKAVQDGFDVRFVILRPNEQTTVARAAERQGPGALVNAEVVGKMWNYFANLGRYESHVIDTTTQNIEESVTAIKKSIDDEAMRLS